MKSRSEAVRLGELVVLFESFFDFADDLFLLFGIEVFQRGSDGLLRLLARVVEIDLDGIREFGPSPEDRFYPLFLRSGKGPAN